MNIYLHEEISLYKEKGKEIFVRTKKINIIPDFEVQTLKIKILTNKRNI